MAVRHTTVDGGFLNRGQIREDRDFSMIGEDHNGPVGGHADKRGHNGGCRWRLVMCCSNRNSENNFGRGEGRRRGSQIYHYSVAVCSTHVEICRTEEFNLVKQQIHFFWI